MASNRPYNKRLLGTLYRPINPKESTPISDPRANERDMQAEDELDFAHVGSETRRPRAETRIKGHALS